MIHFWLARGGTVVKHSTFHLKVKASSLATSDSSGREKYGKKFND